MLCVKPTGSKLWLFNYNLLLPKKVNISFGAYPDLSLAEVRVKGYEPDQTKDYGTSRIKFK